MGILDFFAQPSGGGAYGGLLNLPESQGFPATSKQVDPQALWDAIEAETARQNAAADRQNAAGLKRPAAAPYTPFAAADASSPAVQYALGNIADVPSPVNTTPLTPAEQNMMKLVGGGRPVTPPNAPFGSLAPQIDVPSAPAVAAPVIPLPRPRPAAADIAAPEGTDLSSAGRGSAAAPAAALPPELAAHAEQPQEPQSFLSKLGDKLNQNADLLIGMGAGFAGAPSIGAGISRGLTGASAGAQLDIKRAMQQGAIGPTYTALVKAGVPKEQALAAVYNPTIMKSVTENYLGDRKGQLTDIGFDRYGNPIKGIFDPYSKKITPIASSLEQPGAGSAPVVAAPAPRTAANAAAAIAARGKAEPDPALPGKDTSTDVSSAGRVQGANPSNPANPADASGGVVTAENDVTGRDFLEHLKETDPPYARQVEQIVNGDAPMPTGRLANTPVGRKLRQDVLSIEPGLTDADYATRLQTRKSYTAGPDAKITRSINTTLHHAATLEKAINDLDNYSGAGTLLNTPRALIKGKFSEDYQKAKGAYETAVGNFAKELDFAVSGGRPTVSGTKHQMDGFDLTAPKAEQLSKLREGVDLLNGRLESHAEGYVRGMKKQADPMDFVEPRNKQFFQRLMGTTPTEAAAPVANAAPQTTTGTATSQHASAPAPALPAAISSQSEYDALPAGKTYTAPDGSVRTKR